MAFRETSDNPERRIKFGVARFGLSDEEQQQADIDGGFALDEDEMDAQALELDSEGPVDLYADTTPADMSTEVIGDSVPGVLPEVYQEAKNMINASSALSEQEKSELLDGLQGAWLTNDEYESFNDTMDEMRLLGVPESDINQFYKDFGATAVSTDPDAAHEARREMLEGWQEMNEAINDNPDVNLSAKLSTQHLSDSTLVKESRGDGRAISLGELNSGDISQSAGFYRSARLAYQEWGLKGVLLQAWANVMNNIEAALAKTPGKKKTQEAQLPDEENTGDYDIDTINESAKGVNEKADKAVERAKGFAQSERAQSLPPLNMTSDNIAIYQAVIAGNGTTEEKVDALQCISAASLSDSETIEAAKALHELSKNGVDSKTIQELAEKYTATAAFGNGETAHQTRNSLLACLKEANAELGRVKGEAKDEVVKTLQENAWEIFAKGEKQDISSGRNNRATVFSALNQNGRNMEKGISVSRPILPDVLKLSPFTAIGLKALQGVLDMQSKLGLSEHSLTSDKASLKAGLLAYENDAQFMDGQFTLNVGGVVNIESTWHDTSIGDTAFSAVTYSVDGGPQEMTSEQLCNYLRDLQVEQTLDQLAETARKTSQFSVEIGKSLSNQAVIIADKNGQLSINGQSMSSKEIVAAAKAFARKQTVGAPGKRAASAKIEKAQDDVLQEIVSGTAGFRGVEQPALLSDAAKAVNKHIETQLRGARSKGLQELKLGTSGEAR